MADELTLDGSKITVWADADNPRKITGKVKVNGKAHKTAKTSTTIKSTATVEGKGRVTLTWVAKKKPAPKRKTKPNTLASANAALRKSRGQAKAPKKARKK